MIDFRYHLVSLIAVFLAVALGIVIGTTQLNDPILADIEAQVTDLEQDKRALEDQTQQLQARLDTADDFEQSVAPALVEGALTDRSVLLLTTNEAVGTEIVDEVASLVAQAGGSVTGTLRLQPEYSDPATAAALQSYVTGPGLPPGVQLPETDDAGRLVAALLSQVLMAPADAGSPEQNTAPEAEAGGSPAGQPSTADVSSVVAGLSALDVLTQESASVAPADFAVVLTADAFTADAEERNGTLVELVTALDAAGSGAVVAGDAASAAESGLVGAIRADPTLSAAISTVDNVGTSAGRISTVLALGREAEGTSGKYGTGEDAQPVPPVSPAAP
ncbi:copper transporter [Geodermatophilus sp. YIM 151500]|uniref:copper transporter n=1 Tax=Geodermatophilus sp. YIM 151500 TaxID=2984531 RepID=UPI0021E38E30|nr:copper transporter [Geodermatophilus sp. YIM 151500]MCV2489010.1 copper transporter [Geodermatophilus sp. YIM 151500]